MTKLPCWLQALAAVIGAFGGMCLYMLVDLRRIKKRLRSREGKTAMSNRDWCPKCQAVPSKIVMQRDAQSNGKDYVTYSCGDCYGFLYARVEGAK